MDTAIHVRCPTCAVLLEQPDTLTFMCPCGQLIQSASAPAPSDAPDMKVSCPACEMVLIAPPGVEMFACPCGQFMEAPSEAAGNSFSCPNCSQLIMPPPDDPPIYACGCGQIFQSQTSVAGRPKSNIFDMLAEAEEREAEARQVFNEYDADRSGEISVSELKPMLLKLGFHDGLIDMEFAKADTDGSGDLSFPEFVTYYNSLRDRLQSGSLTSGGAAEAQAQLQLDMQRQQLEIQRQQLQLEQTKLDMTRAGAAHSDGKPVRKHIGTGKEELESIIQQHENEAKNLNFMLANERERQQKALQAKLNSRRKGKKSAIVQG